MPHNDKSEMTFIGHLSELRNRIIISIVSILLAAIISFIFSDYILQFLLLPLKKYHLVAFGLLDGFMIKWNISVFTGIIITFPIWILQIYGFIRPALQKSEQKNIGSILLISFILFLLGMAFAYYLLFTMVSTLIGFFPHEITFLPSANDYISFTIFFIIACGIVFILPPVIVILVKLRILNVNTLRKQRRLAYFILFAFSEIITPVSDPIIAPLTVMIPLILLYEISILWSRMIERKRIKNETILN